MYLLFLSDGPLRLQDYNNTGRPCTCVLKILDVHHPFSTTIYCSNMQLQVNFS